MLQLCCMGTGDKTELYCHRHAWNRGYGDTCPHKIYELLIKKFSQFFTIEMCFARLLYPHILVSSATTVHNFAVPVAQLSNIA